MKSKKTKTKDVLKSVEGELCFYCCNEHVYSTLAELAENLKEMPEDVFGHHSNIEKCDFSNWVGGVFGDVKLADALWINRGQKDKLRATLTSHLLNLNKSKFVDKENKVKKRKSFWNIF